MSANHLKKSSLAPLSSLQAFDEKVILPSATLSAGSSTYVHTNPVTLGGNFKFDLKQENTFHVIQYLLVWKGSH